MEKPSKDMAKQSHYEQLSPQPIDVIRAWKLGFHLGNVIKYVGRCTTKGQELEDLEKAKVYLQWRIDELKAEKAEADKKRALTLQEACDEAVREASTKLRLSYPSYWIK